MNHKESLLEQKARSSWLQHGDKNSKLFHSMMKSRTRINTITSLLTSQGRMDSVADVKETARKFFEARFIEPDRCIHGLENLEFNTLNEEDRQFLEEKFPEEEIKESIWDCDGDRSPDPGGFNLDFLKHCLNIVGIDVINFIQDFHETSILPKAMTTSFVDLIPKVDNP
ncbi:unnamed protein product [Lathyrus oleraceus]